MTEKTDNKEIVSGGESVKESVALSGQSLDDIIRNAEFPDDYEAFEDSMLDMIP